MEDLKAPVRRFLEGGPGLWLAPGQGIAPEGCAVVATSGSSGDAKCVVLSRSALTAAAQAAETRLTFPATWHLCLSPRYVAGLMVLVRGILGLGVRTADPSLTDLQRLPGRNCISIVPTQLYRALEDPELSQRLAGFDAVLVGGAPLLTELRQRAEQAQIRVIETYGMSETCGGVVWDGIALPGIDVRLGGTGQISIGGPTVFEGYLGREELTSETLRDGAVVTRDRGHWAGRRLILDGRIDDVVISGGVNVDLTHVRQAVAKHQSESAVFAVDDPEWGARVVLFTIEGDLARWREMLRSDLPAAWLPRQLVLVDEVPRGAGGKPNREKLLQLVQP